MSLQFDSGAYYALNKDKRNAETQNNYAPVQSANQTAQTMGGLGQDLQAMSDKKKTERLNMVNTLAKLKDSGVDPNAFLKYYETGELPQGQPSVQPQTPQAQPDMSQSGQPYSPSFQPTSSQFPQGMGQVATPNMPSQGPQTAQPYSPPIQPQSRQFPQGMGNVGTPTPPQNLAAVHAQQTGYDPLGLTKGQNQPQQNGAMSLFKKPTPIDPTKLSDPNYLTSLPENQRNIVEKQREFNQKQQELDQKTSDKVSYSAQDVMDAEKGNWNAIAQRNGGKIPPSLATLGESATSKSDTAYEKKRLDAQNAMINVRGDQSIARTEAQRDAAALAYNTIERVKSEGREPSQLEYYDLLGQMWKARTGAAPTDQAIRDLDQKTFQGNLGKAATFFTGKPAGATTRAVLENLQDFVSESGAQAEKQHEAYMAPRQSKILSGLKPEDQESLMNVHRGMSFQEQTGYKGVQNKPKQINSQAEYDALPSGSTYIDSTDKQARKK